MSYNNWEDDYEKTEVEKHRERQREDSMRIMVWAILFAVSLTLFILFIKTCNQIIEIYNK